MKQARECGLIVGFVSVTERKNVVDWLEGRISDSDRIVPLTGEVLDWSGRDIDTDAGF
jgi:parafibromin